MQTITIWKTDDRGRVMDDFLRTTTVEFQGRLEGDAFLGSGRLGVRQLGSVEGVDVSLVMLIVMECHDLLRDVRLEAIVRVRQGREGVVTDRRRRHGSCGGCVYAVTAVCGKKEATDL